jgi:hypothetical protein
MGIKDKLTKLKSQLAQEGTDTKDMMNTYQKVLCGTTTSEEEIGAANDQFKDLLKGVGLLGLFIIPGGSLIIPAAVSVAKKFDINILPDAFNEGQEGEEQEK